MSVSVSATAPAPAPATFVSSTSTKLTATEWEMTEMPLPTEEVRILKMIERGFEDDPSTIYPTLPDLYSFLKMERSKGMEAFLFSKYFSTSIQDTLEKCRGYFPTCPFSLSNSAMGNHSNPIMVQKHATQTQTQTQTKQPYAHSSTKHGGGASWTVSTACLTKLKSSDTVRLQLCNQLGETAEVAECILIYWWKQLMLHHCWRIASAGSADANRDRDHDHSSTKKEKTEKTRSGTKSDKKRAPDGYTAYSNLHAYFILHQYLRMRRSSWNEWVVALVEAGLEWVAHPSMPSNTNNTTNNTYHFLLNASAFLEQNAVWMSHPNLQLYDHQQHIIRLFKHVSQQLAETTTVQPMLVFYRAPTGTGKTMTPLALSMRFKVIYVCGARHIGLSLARSAIALKKRIAFAYGCGCATDIRLHNFAAKVFTTNKNGKIRKIDHTVGDYVDIMVCDAHSYIHAMRYMMAFNNKEQIVVYWDEPTIAMHRLAEESAGADTALAMFQKEVREMWHLNEIPQWVLSSATLPSADALHEMTRTFRDKFGDVVIETVDSHHYEKSVSIVSPDGYTYMPHYESDMMTVRSMVRSLNENRSLRRYLDVKECGQFLYTVFHYIGESNASAPELSMSLYVNDIRELTMHRLKDIYCEVLEAVSRGCETNWELLREMVQAQRVQRLVATTPAPIQKMQSTDSGERSGASVKTGGGGELMRLNSVNVVTSTPSAQSGGIATTPTPLRNDIGMYITASDAHTLTHGPTLFLTAEPLKIAMFCFQTAGIPATLLDKLKENIEHNVSIQKQLEELAEEKRELSNGSSSLASKALDKAEKLADATGGVSGSGVMSKLFLLENKENVLRMTLKRVALPDKYVPNTLEHLRKWVPAFSDIPQMYDDVFRSSVSEEDVERIVKLTGVSNELKMLLLMGIGTVSPRHCTTEYLEMMKKLAGEQRLYLVIADANYLHGTNYQFCHAYISKDLRSQMTQEQLIQAMGRVGRAHLQNMYTVRVRDHEFAKRLFVRLESEEKPEVQVMNTLFGLEEEMDETEMDLLAGDVPVRRA